MKGKKLLAGILSAAILLGTVSFSAFADAEPNETVPLSAEAAVLEAEESIGAGETAELSSIPEAVAGVITLTENVTQATYEITDNVVLDLNQKTLDAAVSIMGNAANVTIKNGTITSDSDYVISVKSKTASLTLENVIILGKEHVDTAGTGGVYFNDSGVNFTMINSEIHAGDVKLVDVAKAKYATAPKSALYLRHLSGDVTITGSTIYGGSILHDDLIEKRNDPNSTTGYDPNYPDTAGFFNPSVPTTVDFISTGKLTVSGCKIYGGHNDVHNAGEAALKLQGNGATTEIIDTLLQGGDAARNCTAPGYGIGGGALDITFNNEQSDITIKDSTLKGGNGGQSWGGDGIDIGRCVPKKIAISNSTIAGGRKSSNGYGAGIYYTGWDMLDTMELENVDFSAAEEGKSYGAIKGDILAKVSGNITITGPTDGFLAIGDGTVLQRETVADEFVPANCKAVAKAHHPYYGDGYYTSLADAVTDALTVGASVTLLCDTTGAAVVVPPSSESKVNNITIDFDGHTYTVDNPLAGSPGTQTNGFHLGKDSTVVMKNGTLETNEAYILIQNYANLTLDNMNLSLTTVHPKGTRLYTMSNNNGTVVLTGNTNISALDGNVAFDVCRFASYPGVSVKLDNNMTGTINGTVELSGTKDGDNDFELIIQNGIINGSIVNEAPTASIQISGGTFKEDVSEYCTGGLMAKNVGGVYQIVPSAAKVVERAEAVTTTVILEDLEKNLKADPEIGFKANENAKYEVVISDPSAEDKAAAPAKTDEANTMEIFDIKVVKIVNGTSATVDVKNQKVTLELGQKIAENQTPIVHHIKNGVKEDITDVTVSDDRMSISFVAPSFSTYYVEYPAVAPTSAEIAENIDVTLANETIDGQTATYDLVISGADDKVINRFMSSEWTFAITGVADYVMTPASNVKMVYDSAKDSYEFNMNGTTYSDATGKSISIAKVTITGSGAYTFNAKTAKIHTAKVADNIVDSFGSAETAATGKVNIPTGPVSGTLEAKKYDLVINVTFNNAINDNAAAYQDMKITVKGGDVEKSFDLGDDGVALNANQYTIQTDLPENTAYTVTVEGAGYRTARYTVTMTADKTLNFWNNVKDTVIAIEEGNTTASKVTKNFLAGDIVKDGKINIYDLSAVVSYFGTTNATGAVSPNAKYDLNRDGVIDSKDVAYVLVSWGE